MGTNATQVSYIWVSMHHGAPGWRMRAEALYMTGLECNGNVVSMASYEPLFAKNNFTQWKTDMIFFDNSGYYLTPNYYAQKMFSANRGDYYVDKVIAKNNTDSLLGTSCVYDSKTGDIIIKLANAGKEEKKVSISLNAFGKINPAATVTQLSGAASAENSFRQADLVAPVTTSFTAAEKFEYTVPAVSVTVMRIKTK